MSTTASRPAIKLHPLTLSFSPDLEGNFRSDYFGRYVHQMRLSLLAGILFFAAFAVLDALMLPEIRWTLWSIRSLVVAAAMVCIGLTYAPSAQRWIQLILFSASTLAGLGILVMLVLAAPYHNDSCWAGLILVIVFNYTLLRLRFVWATLAGWVLLVGYQIAAIAIIGTPTTFLISSSFFLIAANLAGMMGAYAIELSARHDFFWAHRLQDEQFDVQQTTDVLEDRVEQRTAELKTANAALRQEMEARLRLAQTHQRLAVAMDQASEGMIIFDTQGKITYVNPAMERISGYMGDEAVGQPIELIRSHRHPVDFYAYLWQTIADGQVWRGRIVNKRQDGGLFTSDTSITPLRDAAGQIVEFVAVHRDVTRELELEEQFLQAQKMEALGQLTGGIARDFNNLLTAINGFAELMEMQLPDTDPMQEFVKHIMASGQRAAILVRQLLAFGRKQSPERQMLDINDIVSNLQDMLERIIGEHIVLQTELAADLPPVSADSSQLEQVIVNLVVNARDAMPRGGQITISTRPFTMESQFTAANKGARQGDYVLLAVTDNGVGISASVQEHIFEPFFTTKTKGQGSGLGLATVYGIVKQYAGYTTVDSVPGAGARFSIYLPIVRTPAAGPAPDEIPAPPASLPAVPAGAILVAEDNAPMREMVAQVLRAHGYTVLEALDGVDALRVANDYTGPIHLLLTDVVMPIVNGRQLAEQLTARWRELRVLYMSGYIGSPELPAEEWADDSNMLQKPFTPQELLAKIHATLTAPATAEPRQ